MIRNITDTLRLLEDGAFLDKASVKLAELIQQIEATGKSGSLTLSLDIKKVSGGAVSITPKVAAKVPESKSDSTLLWPTEDGNLVQDNPKQQKLDLRSVGGAPTELRSAG